MTRALASASAAAAGWLALSSSHAAAQSCAPPGEGCARAAIDIPVATSRYGPQTLEAALAPIQGPDVQAQAVGAPAPLQAPPAQVAPAPANPVQPKAPPAAPPIHNPFDHDIDLTLSLVYNKRDLGQMPVTLTRDDHVLVHAADFLALVGPLLSPAGLKAVNAAIAGRAVFAPEALAPAGVVLAFDAASLSVVILKITPSAQAEQSLYQPYGTTVLGHVSKPAVFSAYLNVNGGASWSQTTGFSPLVDLQGAVHYGHFVLESDFIGENFPTLSGANATNFQLDRSYVRLVYDDPANSLRFFAGDLQPQFRDDQSSVEIGGVGVLRQTRIFDPTRVATLSNTQQLVLDSDSTIDILRNGSLIQQLHLAAGSYNLNNLPLTSGSNNVQIVVHGLNGFSQTLSYSTYLDPIDLLPGDYEYGAYAGILSTTTIFTPQYGSDPAFTGFYRKAFLNGAAFGVGLQADRDVQMADGEYRLILRDGSRVGLQAAVSEQKGFGGGGSVSVGYDRIIQRGALLDALDVRLTYNSEHFAQVGVVQAINPQEWQLSASYTRSFTTRLQGLANAFVSYDRTRRAYQVSSTAEVQYQLSSHWQFTFGVSYQNETTEVLLPGQTGSPPGQFGAIVSIVWRPDVVHRVEADYDGSRDTETLTVSRSHDAYVGDWGYTAFLQGQPGQDALSVEGDYVADRFLLTVDGDTEGESFGSLTSQKSASVNVGTSIAFADGHFALGAPISDSFLIAYPHSSLDGRSVIVGDDLQNGQYNARSDLFGPALYAILPSYTTSQVHYDVLNPPAGYDIGTGVDVVRPTYRSGFALQVGSDAFISATGTLVGFDGHPISLVSGRVIDLGDPKSPSQPFFTNSVGRFALESLRPGVQYRVVLNTADSASFVFETPKTGAALVDLKTVKLQSPSN